MKKLYLLLPILFLFYWSCEKTYELPSWILPTEEDTTPTEVTLWGEVYSVEDTDSLDLSNNQLTGEIPSEIGSLTNLTLLTLNGNQITGEIPPEIGNLTNLEYLYLYNNQLTGVIPESICDLTLNFTDYRFNISNNQLCPPYPSCIEDYVGEQDTSDCP